MKHKGLSGLCLLALLALIIGMAPGAAESVDAESLSQAPALGAPTVESEPDWGRMPVYFIENQGQIDERVSYYVQGSDKAIYFTPDGVTFALTHTCGVDEDTSPHAKPEAPRRMALWSQEWEVQRWVVKLDFVGANPHVRPVAEERQETVISYFRDSPDEWHTGLPTYARLVYRDLWPGIDLIYQGTSDRLKYQFVVHPGADPAQIRLAYRGASSVSVNEAGQLEVTTQLGGFMDDAPVAYQMVEGRRVEVAMAYELPAACCGALSPLEPGRETLERSESLPSLEFSFSLGAYDNALPLVLDPAVLIYCGYIGGSTGDDAKDIAVDASGQAYVTGQVYSSEAAGFPALVGPDLTFNGEYDAFVAKVKADGSGLVYAGYIGGSGYDIGWGIAVDSADRAYVVGTTTSTEATFPASAGPDLTYNGSQDAFVAKVKADGTDLVYCGYVGGSGNESLPAIAVNTAGEAHLTGYTNSSADDGFPLLVGPDLTFNGGSDAFVTKVQSDGSGLVYSGYVGGWDADSGKGIALDDLGRVYITGTTNSNETSFPVTVGPDLTFNGYSDAFVAKVWSDGSGLAYCGYIGGSDSENASGIAVDYGGRAYVTGWTHSSEAEGFPVLTGPDLTHNGGEIDAFVARVQADGVGLEYAGYVGGEEEDYSEDISVDLAGHSYIVGRTLSSEATFPVLIGPDLTYNGKDAFVAMVRADGSDLSYCGYIGGSSIDRGNGIAVDGAGQAYVTGSTSSSTADGFPVLVGPDLTHNGYIDAFVAKISGAETYSVSGRVTDDSGLPVVGVTVTASSYSVVTDDTGDYTITGLLAGSYSLVPSKPCYSFSPSAQIVSLPPDAVDQDFVASLPGGQLPDMGFRPDPDGYHFENYLLTSPLDYTPDDMRIMFGDDCVCQWMVGGVCVAKPQAILFHAAAHAALSLGHCEGMASTSLRFFEELDSPSEFQQWANETFDLDKENVRRHIAYYHVKQMANPVLEYKHYVRQEPPSVILDDLCTHLSDGANDSTILFMKQQGVSVGHAVTPYAVTETAEGAYRVNLYDNEYPSVGQWLEINPLMESWSYYTGPEPGTWSGDANSHSLGIIPVSLYSGDSECPWDESQVLGGSTSSGEVWLTGRGHLLITDEQGRQIGFLQDQLVNGIPGAYESFIDAGLSTQHEPIYTLPMTQSYTILLDGQPLSQTETVSVTQFGPGYAASAADISLAPDNQDLLTLAPDGRQLSYTSTDAKSPTLILAPDTVSGSYLLQVSGADVGQLETITLSADLDLGHLAFSNAEASGGSYGLEIKRVSNAGQEGFLHNGILIEAEATHYFDYGTWDGAGAITVYIDEGSNGSIDDTMELENEWHKLYLPLILRGG